VAQACAFDAGGSNDPDGTIDAYLWDFGDGSSSQEVAPSYTFGSPGSYSVTLTVIDNSGSVDTSTRQVTVGSTAANIAFVGSSSATANARKVSVTVPAGVVAGNGMLLFATAANSTTTLTPPAGWASVDSEIGSGIQTQVWQQVAGDTSAGSTVTVNLVDTAKVTLMVAAYSGTSSSTPVAQEAISSESVVQAGHITPTLATSLTGAWLVSYWADVSASTTGWTTPPAQTVRASAAGTNTGHVTSVLADLNGPLTIGNVGGYIATASSASAKAAMATLVLTPEGVAPPNQPPTASFTDDCTALACHFDASGSTDPDGTVASYAWTFGDTGTSTLQAPDHTFGAAGQYSVTLTVTDDDGATDTETRQVNVTSVATSIGFVGSSSATANAKKVTVTVPPAVTAGNGLLLMATSANATTALTAPAGWTLVDSGTGSQVQTRIWQQVATGASAGSSVSVNLADIAKVSLVLTAYSGTSTTSPVAEHAVSAETVSALGHTTPTVSTAVTGGWLVSYWSDVSTDTASFTTPAGQATRASIFGSGGGHVSSVVTDLNGPLTVGTVGGYTATSNAASAKAVMATLVLAPAS
jgi:PKD repeat protein